MSFSYQIVYYSPTPWNLTRIVLGALVSEDGKKPKMVKAELPGEDWLGTASRRLAEDLSRYLLDLEVENLSPHVTLGEIKEVDMKVADPVEWVGKLIRVRPI